MKLHLIAMECDLPYG